MSSLLTAVAAVAGVSIPGFGNGVLENAVRAANGWIGMFIIFAYSVLIAIVLPLPSEIVLVPAMEGTLELGFPMWGDIALVILISSLGKAVGSVGALALGHRASRSGPAARAIQSLGFDPMAWSKRRTVELVQQYGYVGLACGLMIPAFPDTLPIYAFSVLDLERAKFGLAAFVGSVGRLLITLFVVEGATSLS